jgi:ankyrin repeat protein
MVRFTRKRKQRGKCKQHGGGTHKLPGVDTINTIEEFEKEWDTYYLSAHGALLENEPLITVPKNLYILFMGSAGYLCFNTKLNQEFEQCLIKRGDDCGYKHGTYETNFLPVMKNLNRIFPSIYNPKEVGIQSPSEDISSSIYEPGDKIFDVKMDFNNTNYFGIRGLFQVPLQTELITDIFNEVGHYMTDKEAHVSKKTIDTLTDNMLANDENLIKPLLSRMREKRSSDPSYNRYSMSLSYILDAIDKEILRSDKKTFLVIKACRRANDENPETLKQVRRHSVELRKYNVNLPWAQKTKTTRRPRKAPAPKKREPPSYDEVYNAIEKDNVAAIRKYVKEGFKINQKYTFGSVKTYPIFDAISLGKQKVFNEFIKLGADVKVKNNFGQTTLFVAANKRQIAMVNVLLQKGLDPNEADEAGDVPINRAFAQENLEMIKMLIAHGARITTYIENIANAEDDEGFQNPEIKKIVNSLRHYNYKENYSNYFNKNELNE